MCSIHERDEEEEDARSIARGGRLCGPSGRGGAGEATGCERLRTRSTHSLSSAAFARKEFGEQLQSGFLEPGEFLIQASGLFLHVPPAISQHKMSFVTEGFAVHSLGG